MKVIGKSLSQMFEEIKVLLPSFIKKNESAAHIKSWLLMFPDYTSKVQAHCSICTVLCHISLVRWAGLSTEGILQYVFQYGVMSEVSSVNCSTSNLPYWFLSVVLKIMYCLAPSAPEENYYFFISSWIFHLYFFSKCVASCSVRWVICPGHVHHVKQIKSWYQC